MNKLLLLLVWLLISCNDTNNNGINKIVIDLEVPNFKQFEKKQIYFGHKSVGYNILDGLNKIAIASKSDSFSIAELNDLKNTKINNFIHSQIGNNGYPKSKIDDFANELEYMEGNKLDFAFMKFCYVDFDTNTNVDSLFGYYKSRMDELESEFPLLTILHFTVPLMSKRSFLGKVKDFVLCKGDDYNFKNYLRNKFNSLLIDNYPEKKIIDIARVESTTFNGQRHVDDFQGRKNYFLIDAYTYDGGHLNEIGQIIVAKELVSTIVKN